MVFMDSRREAAAYLPGGEGIDLCSLFFFSLFFFNFIGCQNINMERAGFTFAP